MKKLVAILLILLPFLAQASLPSLSEQPWPLRSGKSLFPSVVLTPWRNEAELKELANNYLKTNIPDLQSGNAGLHLYSMVQSPFGWHLSYFQAYKGIDIYGTEVKINVASGGRVLSVFYKTQNTANWPFNIPIGNADLAKIKSILGACDTFKVQHTLYPDDAAGVIPAYQVEYWNRDGSLHKETVISTDYVRLFEGDLDRYDGGKDTSAMGMVFYPDPLTSARKAYGFPYVDANDSDIPELNAERVKKPIPATLINDTFFLVSPFAKIVDISPPSTPVTYSTDGMFDFTRHEFGFEDVNAFFHIHNYRKHLADLGFGNLGSKQLLVDAHALSGIDNSKFMDADPNNLCLLFGQGGIDDAEDADVIIHEYSHYLSYSASPNSVFGSERSALDEGLCDYFACSYSRDISDYNWQKVYSWDGNETWNGRSCYTSKLYPTDLTYNDHTDGEIWSGALMQVWEQIGRDQTDKLMLATLYSMGKYITMSDAAKLFLQSDTLADKGKDVWRIVNEFVDRGFLPESYKTAVESQLPSVPYKLISSYFSTDNLIYLEFDLPQTGTVSLYDMQGKMITSQNITNSAKVNIVTSPLSSGIYILHISTGGVQKSEKLLRY